MSRCAYGPRHVFAAPKAAGGDDGQSETRIARAGLTATEAERVLALRQARYAPNQIAAVTRLPYRAIRIALGLPP